MKALSFQTLAEACAEVDASGPRRWLVRGIWPAGAYGVHAAEMKAQKTWNGLDLAVSVASGTSWLNAFPVDDPGPVVVFAGEGGKAGLVRRIRAIAESRGVRAEELSIVVCVRAPHLSSTAHLDQIRELLAELRPRLVVLDPLYLAAGGADGKDLYAMGKLLEAAQHLCDEVDSALFVTTHYNRREGSGPSRFTGAGPAEWGRVLLGANVKSRSTDRETHETDVVTEFTLIGGEVPDQTFRIRRRIRATDPESLDSPLAYSVELLTIEAGAADADDRSPAARKLLEALEAVGRPATGTELVDWIAREHGHGLKRETVSRHLNELLRAKAVEASEETVGKARLWALPGGFS